MTKGKRITRKIKQAEACGCNDCVSRASGKPLRQLRVALCLLGQPRRYAEGHKVFMEFIHAPHHINIKFDVFFHAWKLPQNGSFVHSAYRELSPEELVFHDNTVDDLVKLYDPISYVVNDATTFDRSKYENTLLYNRSSEFSQNNANNTISQFYSRQKVRNLVLDYAKKHKINYDFIIGSRFDFIQPLDIDLNKLDPNGVHLTDCRFPRKHLPDPLVICNQNTFSKMFNVYNNLHNIVNNEELAEHFAKECNEEYIFEPEQTMHMNYIWHFKNNNAFRYHTGIPNFY